MEVWDGYYSDGSLAGIDLIRGDHIPSGLHHIVSEILVRYVDGSYLLMQRDFSKLDFPGMYEVSAGGSALKGENAFSAAIRELKEETGIIPINLVELNKTVRTTSILYYFLATTDCDKSSVTLQEGETVSFRWISKEEFKKFIASSECIPTQREPLSEYFSKLD